MDTKLVQTENYIAIPFILGESPDYSLAVLWNEVKGEGCDSHLLSMMNISTLEEFVISFSSTMLYIILEKVDKDKLGSPSAFFWMFNILPNTRCEVGYFVFNGYRSPKITMEMLKIVRETVFDVHKIPLIIGHVLGRNRLARIADSRFGAIKVGIIPDYYGEGKDCIVFYMKNHKEV